MVAFLSSAHTTNLDSQRILLADYKVLTNYKKDSSMHVLPDNSIIREKCNTRELKAQKIGL